MAKPRHARASLTVRVLVLLVVISVLINAGGWMWRVLQDRMSGDPAEVALGGVLAIVMAALMLPLEYIAYVGVEAAVRAYRTPGERWRAPLAALLFVLSVPALLYSGHQALGYMLALDLRGLERAAAKAAAGLPAAHDRLVQLDAVQLDDADRAAMVAVQRLLIEAGTYDGALDGLDRGQTSRALAEARKAAALELETAEITAIEAADALTDAEHLEVVVFLILILAELGKAFGRSALTFGDPGGAAASVQTTAEASAGAYTYAQRDHLPPPPPGFQWRREPPSTRRPEGRCYLYQLSAA